MNVEKGNLKERPLESFALPFARDSTDCVLPARAA